MATKTGTSGNDFIYGGGPDTLVGLQGDDTFVAYSAADAVVEVAGDGRDTLLSFASYVLAAGVSVETLSTATNADTATINLTGNELSQIIVGNYGTNTLDGRGGGDALVGFGGNDVYVVYGRTDLVVENANEGSDRIEAHGDFVLSAGSSVELIRAADFASTLPLFLAGNELVQSIGGNAGNNLINGGGGADVLSGGPGDDTYRVFGNGEVIQEFTGSSGGNDAVYASGSFSLQPSNGIELLSTAIHAGTEAINLTGNESIQTLIGNFGNDILDGRAGGDALIGLRGDDIYRVYGLGDVVVENAGEGNDAVFSSGDFALRLGQSVETLSTAQNSATTAINLAGNELAQVVIGNFGVNVLDGGAGTDVLYGLADADIFRFSTALGAGNVDTLADFGNGADTLQLDPTIFTGLATGTLAASAIAYGAAAGDADDRVIYNPQSGALSFDSDGTGSTAAIQFAILPTALAASAIAVNVAPTSNAGPVRITASGTYLIGGATGAGVNLDTTYPEATSFTFESGNSAAVFNLVYGPASYGVGKPPISFTTTFGVGTFDFTQLGTGVSLRPNGQFQTTGGTFIVAVPQFEVIINPFAIIGSPFDDFMDQSVQPGGAPLFQGPRQGGNLSGGAGNDTLLGARVLDGGTGDDLLIGRQSVQMTGGAGADAFRLPIDTNTTRTISNPNQVVDFGVGADRIELVLNRPSDLSPGALPANRFGVGSAATTPDQRIFYDPATGVLGYDSNGSLPNTDTTFSATFARLAPNLDLTAASFSVVPGAN